LYHRPAANKETLLLAMSSFQTTVCTDPTRRIQIEQDQNINGIDYVEVVTSPAADNERVLQVFFIPKDPGNVIGQANLTLLMQNLALAPQEITIQGGVRVQNIQVLGVTFAGDHIDVRVSEPGDFSDYTLTISDPAVDIFYSQVQFNFKAGCPTHFDCRPVEVCPPVLPVAPTIDYMAKDYASFRRALLDFIPTLKPSWTERHEADIGMVLLELLAYTGDQLSYYQDAVSNELYLGTARQRISVRRLARLIDYQMHDGASARAFIYFQLTGGTTGFLPQGTQVLSRITVPIGDKLPPHSATFTAADAQEALNAAGTIFETLTDVQLSDQLNSISIYTWGNSLCCLPRGVTSVYLAGDLSAAAGGDLWRLKPGDFLLFEEVLGPITGLAADADPAHRQVVRLTSVERATDPLEVDPHTGTRPALLTRVTWAREDALTFPLCLSVKLADNSVVNGVSVARGNLVLADHGETITEWFPGNPVDPTVPGIITGERDFRFLLQQGPLSFRIPYASSDGPETTVAGLLTTDPQQAQPQVTRLDVDTATQVLGNWVAVTPDLLRSHATDRHFLVETENDGRALIRFGDGVYGLDPPNGSHFFVQYRIGVGTSGNAGRDSLVHVIDPGTVLNFPSLVAMRNPLAAWGGIDPQPLEQVKLLAPAAFQAIQFRAVTEEDYAKVAERWPEVSKAVATFRWTGSWYTVFITVDPVGRNDLPPDMAQRVLTWVTGFTQAGYDLEINAPIYVPLDIVVDVCVAPYHFRADVEQALLLALSNRVLPDGSLGFFHPDNFTFGQPLYLSQLYKAIMAVDGVDSASVTRFQRFGKPANHELEQGYIATDRLEIVRLDNDPNFRENGVLRLNMGGSK
jgi:hypothetical protein